MNGSGKLKNAAHSNNRSPRLRWTSRWKDPSHASAIINRTVCTVAWPAYNATMDPYQLLVAPTISAAAGLKTDLCDFWDQLAANGVD